MEKQEAFAEIIKLRIRVGILESENYELLKIAQKDCICKDAMQVFGCPAGDWCIHNYK